MHLFISVFALLFISPTAHSNGWQEVGNGGEGLFCVSDFVTNYEALDFYETTTRYRLKPHLPELEIQNDIEIARVLINRLQRVPNVPPLALDLLTRFYAETQFVPAGSMPSAMDGGTHLYIPDVCEIIQVAVQRPPLRGTETHFYTLNQDAWKWMSSTQRGIIIAHEVLYRIAIGFGEPETSESLRYVMALLIADQFKYLPKTEAAAVLNSARLWLAPDTPHLMFP